MSHIYADDLCNAAGIGWHQEKDADALAQVLSTTIAEHLQMEIEAAGAASLVVSGGSTPAPVFSRLSQTDMDWSRVTVTLADERWVPPGHKDSNESLVRNLLLINKASSAGFVSLYREGKTAEQAVPIVAKEIAAMPQPFTVSILGMGGDGHTASLFPDASAEQLDVAMALDNTDMLAVLDPPSVAQTRISLTRAALLDSKKRFLHITGDGKSQVLADALKQSCKDNAPPGVYNSGMKPVVGLLTSGQGDVAVYWSP